MPRRPFSRFARSLVLVGVALGLPATALAAGGWRSIFGHDVDVLTVTDVSKKGRDYRTATTEDPVYCMIIDQGEVNFGRSWAGEQVPPPADARKWLMKAMARQGYLVADEAHPPTQILLFGWGMLDGRSLNTSSGPSDAVPGAPGIGFSQMMQPEGFGPRRLALRFLGGDKTDLMWEQEQEQLGGFVNPRVLHRGMERVGIKGKVWDFAGGSLFLGIVRSISFEEDPVLLWETRFACPSDGLALDDALPLMIRAAAVNFGRDTPLPVSLNATDEFVGRVELGNTRVIEGRSPSQTPPASKTPTDKP